MVDRYQPTQIATGNLGAPSATYQGVQHQVKKADPNFKSDAIGGLLDLAGGIAKQMWSNKVEETYTEAARARHLGESLESIESNVFLQPFVNGGYQDMDFQIKQAEMQGEMQRFINAEGGKRVTPAEFQKLLKEKTRDVWDGSQGGLSTKGRQQALQASLEAEASLMSAHNKAYQGWLLEEQYNKLSVLASTGLQAIQSSAGGNTLPAVEQMASTMLRLHAELPRAQAEPLLEKLMATMYQDGLIAEADMLFQGGSGGFGVTADWSIDTRYKVAQEQRKAHDKDLTKLDSQTALEIAVAQQKYEAGQVATMEDINSMSAASRQVIGNKGLAKLLMGKATVTTPDQALINAQVFNTGDVSQLNAKGIPVADAGKDFYRHVKATAPDKPLEFLPKALRPMLSIGHIAPEMIQDLDRSVSNILNSSDGQGTQYDQDMFNTFINMYRASHASGTGTALIAQLENNVSNVNQGVLATVMLDTTGRPVLETLADAKIRADGAVVQSTNDRVITAKNKETITKAIDTTLESETSNSMWRFLKLTTGIGKQELAPNSAAYNQYRDGVAEEMQRLFTSDPSMANLLVAAPEVAVARAMQNLTERVIPLTVDSTTGLFDYNRMLILPKQPNGTVPFKDAIDTLEDGTRLQSSPQALQRALNKVLNLPKGHTVEFVPTSTGGIRPVFIDVNDPAKYVTQPDLDPKAIQAEILKERERTEKVVQDAYLGTTHKAYDPVTGVTLNIPVNGMNVQGLPAEKVLAWRKNLIDSEGARQKQYKDSTTDAWGIGHNIREDFTQMYDELTRGTGMLDSDGIAELFASDSDFAITEGARLARSFGIDDPDAQLAMAEMVFQLGAEGASKFGQTFKQLAEAKDFASLKARSRKWKWYKQTPERVDKFLDSVQPLFED